MVPAYLISKISGCIWQPLIGKLMCVNEVIFEVILSFLQEDKITTALNYELMHTQHTTTTEGLPRTTFCRTCKFVRNCDREGGNTANLIRRRPSGQLDV